jgi:hypothetical protein
MTAGFDNLAAELLDQFKENRKQKCSGKRKCPGFVEQTYVDSAGRTWWMRFYCRCEKGQRIALEEK